MSNKKKRKKPSLVLVDYAIKLLKIYEWKKQRKKFGIM